MFRKFMRGGIYVAFFFMGIWVLANLANTIINLLHM